MTGGGTTGQEKVAIQAVEGTGDTIMLYAQSTGGGNVTIDSIIVKTADGAVFDAAATAQATGYTTNAQIGESLTTVTVTLSGDLELDPGKSYTATIVSVAGNQFVSSSFKAA